jgi:hypothetical protein
MKNSKSPMLPKSRSAKEENCENNDKKIEIKNAKKTEIEVRDKERTCGDYVK